jgi:hypothetical protein
MLTPIEATELLNLCQIPFDIQGKILMYFLSYGTSSSGLIKIKVENMHKKPNYKKLLYTERTLTSYYTCLSLFNYMRGYYAELGYDLFDAEDNNKIDEEILPEFLHEFAIAYTLYHFHDENDINKIMEELKAVTKIRLNKMIASEPII